MTRCTSRKSLPTLTIVQFEFIARMNIIPRATIKCVKATVKQLIGFIVLQSLSGSRVHSSPNISNFFLHSIYSPLDLLLQCYSLTLPHNIICSTTVGIIQFFSRPEKSDFYLGYNISIKNNMLIRRIVFTSVFKRGLHTIRENKPLG